MSGAVSGASRLAPLFGEGTSGRWHAVACAHEMVATPVAITLLGEAIVLWRTSHGGAHAMHDLCIHRGRRRPQGSIAACAARAAGRRQAELLSVEAPR